MQAGAGNDVSLIAAGSYSSIRVSPIQENRGPWRGCWYFLNVTANPGGAETLALTIQIQDAVTGGFRAIASFPVTTAAVNRTYAYCLDPGAALTTGVSGVAVQRLALPSLWRATVQHSGAGVWGYSLAGLLIPF